MAYFAPITIVLKWQIKNELGLSACAVRQTVFKNESTEPFTLKKTLKHYLLPVTKFELFSKTNQSLGKTVSTFANMMASRAGPAGEVTGHTGAVFNMAP